MSIFGKSSALPFLMWLLIAPFFNQIEGNNTIPLSKSMCRGCASCSNGLNGHNGLPGRDGRDGAKGEKGVAGPSGSRGVKGDVGPKGSDADYKNWKQCAWKAEDNRDIGLIKDCTFNKQKDNTTLRVVFQGNFYVGCCDGCCKRWFITFNGAECSGPLPIDAVNYIRHSNQNNHRHGAIEGYCNNIHKGKSALGSTLETVQDFATPMGTTGWQTVSRLIIEEVPLSQ